MNQKQNHLKSTIGLSQAVALYIGSVLGSGVLLVPGLAAEIAGPASLVAWGVMTLLVVPLALSMGLLAAKYPNAGGAAHFVSLAFGPRAGAIIGWFFLMSVPIGVPVVALTGAGYLSTALGLGEGYRLGFAAAIIITGLTVNLLGMKLAGQIQIGVVAGIIGVLAMAIVGSVPHIQPEHFTPFMPNGWVSVGQAAAILFWCFIGWEAVSHLSEEFVNPEEAAVKGATIAALVVGVFYFLTALSTVGTGSYGVAGSYASLVLVIQRAFGEVGAIAAGFTGLFICTATSIAYIGAGSRVAFALARSNDAPKGLGRISEKYGTPLGGLMFLAGCFALILAVYGSGLVPLTTLIQLPNATFILTYLGGCAAGVKLLRGNSWGVAICWLSLLLTAAIFPFVGWAVIYPLVVVVGLTLAKGLAPSENKAL